MTSLLRLFIRNGDLSDRGVFLLTIGAVAAVVLKIGGAW